MNGKPEHSQYGWRSIALVMMLVCASVLSTAYALGSEDSGNSIPVVIESGSGVETASYIIYKDGSYTCAKDGFTGRIVLRSQDASNVISTITEMAAGGIVYVAPGTYNTNIEIRGSVDLRGAYNNGTVLVRDNQSLPVISSNGSDFISISNLKIDGTNNLASSYYSVRLRNSSDVLIQNCYFVNGGTVRTLEVTDRNDAGWYLAEISRIRIMDNIFENNTLNAIGSICANDVVISGNMIYNCGDVGIELSGGGWPYAGITNVIIEKNFIKDVWVGIIATEMMNENGSKLLISENLIEGVNYSGINVQSPTWKWGAGGVVISDNHVTGAQSTGSMGITVTRCPETMISDNYVSGFGYESGAANWGGIKLFNSNYSSIIGNTVANKDNYSIIIQTSGNVTGSHNCSVVSNMLIGNGIADGVYSDAPSTRVDGNRIIAMTKAMYLLSDHHVITNNQMDYNTNGVYLVSSSNTTIQSNAFYGTTPPGKELIEQGTSDYNTIRFNMFSTVYTLVKLGTHTIISENRGYVTEAHGSAVISSGATQKAVYPALSNYAVGYTSIIVVGTTAETSGVWVEYTPGDNYFWVKVSSAVSADTTIYWVAYS